MTSANMEKLYIRTPGGTAWRRHIRWEDRNRHFPRFYPELILMQQIPEPPEELGRATVQCGRDYIELLATSEYHHWVSEPPIPLLQCYIPPTTIDIAAGIRAILKLEYNFGSAKFERPQQTHNAKIIKISYNQTVVRRRLLVYL